MSKENRGLPRETFELVFVQPVELDTLDIVSGICLLRFYREVR